MDAGPGGGGVPLTLAPESREDCIHCGSPIELPVGPGGSFCCHGCETVHGLIHREGFDQYYAIAGERRSPPAVPLTSEEVTGAEAKWLQDMKGRGVVEADIQGIHCAACVWLVEKSFQRIDGAFEVQCNPALGRVHLTVDGEKFELDAWAALLRRFGYRLGPPTDEEEAASTGLLWRLGVSAALSMNVMLISIGFYLGMEQAPQLHRVFSWVALVLTTLNVGVGGWPFFQSALVLVRARVLHLDLPIALGILGSFVGSVLALWWGREAYFDSLSMFITLMLAGRFVQVRALERNRNRLRDHTGTRDWVVKRLLEREEGGREVEAVSLEALRAGDVLLVPPGLVVPVEGVLRPPVRGVFDLSWITGESEPVVVPPEGVVIAGAVNRGGAAVEVEAGQGWHDSSLRALLDRPPAATADPGWLSRVAAVYVPLVLVLGAGAFLWWLPAGLGRALEVTTAVWVVSCPCAFGIAVPLAREIALGKLRARGVLVRTMRFFERMPRIQTVAFDKTGTLTLGELDLVDASLLQDLSPDALSALQQMVARSEHPVSVAIRAALPPGLLQEGVSTLELPGEGVEYRAGDVVWRLGRPGFALEQPGMAEGTVLSQDGEEVAVFQLRERAAGDLPDVFRGLRSMGLGLAIVSGDKVRRVEQLVRQEGLTLDDARGDCSPLEKAQWVRDAGGDSVLMIGDGINDAGALSVAGLSGVPVSGVPILPASADFTFGGENIRDVLFAVGWGRQTRRAEFRTLRFAVAYNLGAVAAALAGWVSPLVAAIAMPASSVVVLALVAYSQRELEGAR